MESAELGDTERRNQLIESRERKAGQKGAICQGLSLTFANSRTGKSRLLHLTALEGTVGAAFSVVAVNSGTVHWDIAEEGSF